MRGIGKKMYLCTRKAARTGEAASANMLWLSVQLADYAKKKEAAPLKRYTKAELNALLDEAEANIAAGRGIPHEEVMREMSAFEVKDKLVEALKTDRYDWIVVNFANADMVGHTGVYTAIQTAVKTIDQCLNEVVETAKTMGYDVIITADHGNADHAVNADGTPNTAHSTNPVPFIYVTANKSATVQSGILADVAPSILHIMGLQQPKEMTGQCLISE